MKLPMRKKSSGFTLIEVVTVIVILGVLSAATTSFIRLSTQIFSETTARDQLISSARFAIERLNREVRNALPNSLLLSESGKCLEFTPIIESTIYTDIPVAPEMPTDKIKVIQFMKELDSNWHAIVYPLTPRDVYPLTPSNTDKTHAVNSIDKTGDEWVITLNNNVLFSEHSPTKRLYLINVIEGEVQTVRYCLNNERLTRNNILMAQDISHTKSSFEVEVATLERNGLVRVHFQFEKNSEKITFTNEIQVLNVP